MAGVKDQLTNWPKLRAEILATAERVGAELRALPDGGLRLRRVTWSAAEVGAHLVTLPRRYRPMAMAPRPFPASLAAENEDALRSVPERDPVGLAGLLEAGGGDLLTALGDDGTRPAWYFSVRHTAAGLGGIMLSELLVHGWDLAEAQRRPWPITRPQAAACLRGIVPALVLAADPEVAATAAGVYHLHLRGADDWTIRVNDGAVGIEPGRPRRADLRLFADPVVFLRNGYGLVSNTRAALTGGIVAYGRRPWLAATFGRLFAET